MTARRIALSVSGLPKMLQGILHETLERLPEVVIVEVGPADALVSDDADAVMPMLVDGQVERVLVIDQDGSGASLHNLREPVRRIEALSRAALLEALGLTEPDPPGWFARLLGRGGPPGRTASPDPASLQSVSANGAEVGNGPLRDELCRLAARLLVSRGSAPVSAGPAADLHALIKELARRAPSRPLRPQGLARTARLFALTEIETDLLFLAALVEVDPLAARLVALLNDHFGRSRPTLGLAANFGGVPASLAFRTGAEGPFLRYDLARFDGDEPLINRPISVPNDLWPMLLDLRRSPPFEILDLRGVGISALLLPEMAAETAGQLATGLDGRPGRETLVAVAGPADSGRGALARAFASCARPSALLAYGRSLGDATAVARLCREAVLADCAVVIAEVEAMAPTLWTELSRRLDAPLFVTTVPGDLPRLARDAARPLIEFAAPARDVSQRMRLWRAQVPPDWSYDEISQLAERFDLGSRGIATALGLAKRRADIDGNDPFQPAQARRACETLRETRFAGTAEPLDCPFAPEDIVLRPETRAELGLAVAWARHGARLFGDGGAAARLRAGGGLACLFSGAPGTGKTMAAQIVARQVDYALYRIDLSQVVDKFIGESEKRLAGLFDEAERSRVALFFDEADALFGKRTEVKDSHDRYANITVNYLLQRLETFNGLAILATNLAGNLDEAFLRRVRIRAEFAKPDAADRRRIWERLLPEDRAADIDLGLLSGAFDLVGGEIRNAVYTAHLLAAQEGAGVTMRHCAAGLWRELGKVGRISDLAALGPWRHAALARLSG